MNIKRSFFERLSGAGSDDLDTFEEELPVSKKESKREAKPEPLSDDAPISEGELPVDVHQTAGDIVIQAFVAGVRPDELSISISRDRVEIEGSRLERNQAPSADYFTRELFWGSFSRTIVLPQEIDVDAATASAKDGLLTIILPRLDKARQTKLRVKAG